MSLFSTNTNTKPLTNAVWGGNKFVKTLSNSHSPVILREGMRRKKEIPKHQRRDREQSSIGCPELQKKPTV